MFRHSGTGNDFEIYLLLLISSRLQQTYSNSKWQRLGVSWAVCLCLLISVGVLCSLELSWGYLGGCMGGVWWYLSGIYGNWGRPNVFGGYLGYQSLQYGAITLYWYRPEKPNYLWIKNHSCTWSPCTKWHLWLWMGKRAGLYQRIFIFFQPLTFFLWPWKHNWYLPKR